MTEATSAPQNNTAKYTYNYADKCDCSEDDNCGCSYPNNMPHDFGTHCPKDQENSCSNKGGNKLKPEEYDYSYNHEKTEIKTENVHLKEESICICSPKECECSITRNEKSK